MRTRDLPLAGSLPDVHKPSIRSVLKPLSVCLSVNLFLRWSHVLGCGNGMFPGSHVFLRCVSICRQVWCYRVYIEIAFNTYAYTQNIFWICCGEMRVCFICLWCCVMVSDRVLYARMILAWPTKCTVFEGSYDAPFIHKLSGNESL